MPIIPIIKVGAEFEAVGVEAMVLLVEGAGGVGAGEEAVGAG